MAMPARCRCGTWLNSRRGAPLSTETVSSAGRLLPGAPGQVVLAGGLAVRDDDGVRGGAQRQRRRRASATPPATAVTASTAITRANAARARRDHRRGGRWWGWVVHVRSWVGATRVVVATRPDRPPVRTLRRGADLLDTLALPIGSGRGPVRSPASALPRLCRAPPLGRPPWRPPPSRVPPAAPSRPIRPRRSRRRRGPARHQGRGARRVAVARRTRPFRYPANPGSRSRSPPDRPGGDRSPTRPAPRAPLDHRRDPECGEPTTHDHGESDPAAEARRARPARDDHRLVERVGDVPHDRRLVRLADPRHPAARRPDLLRGHRPQHRSAQSATLVRRVAWVFTPPGPRRAHPRVGHDHRDRRAGRARRVDTAT